MGDPLSMLHGYRSSQDSQSREISQYSHDRRAFCSRT
jgi:hypothetical protein